MRILGIETSCDETALAIVEGRGERTNLVRSLVASQVAIHKKYGGVVPEVAARCHAEALPAMLDELLGKTRSRTFDAIAVTAGPGLITSLRVGVDAARSLAFAWQKPLIAVNHIEGHIAANWLDSKGLPQFPVLALVVSGGHTEIILVRDHGEYDMLGATRDDAAGEAFDKVAKVVGLGYPGGPAVSKSAEGGDPTAIPFPRPMLASGDLDFSFSGLKTAVLQHVQVHGRRRVADIAASFQAAAVDVLVKKTIVAAGQVQPKTIVLAGGVAANTVLRTALRLAVSERLPGVQYIEPRLAYTTDNAGMIAAAGYYLFQKGRVSDWQTLEPDAQWEIGRGESTGGGGYGSRGVGA
jgi:N6-L-threonylcarbamoyladenine synthase